MKWDFLTSNHMECVSFGLLSLILKFGDFSPSDLGIFDDPILGNYVWYNVRDRLGTIKFL